MPKVQFELDNLMPFISEQLEEGKTVRFSPLGTSMLPMLRQHVDSVILSSAPETLRKYDIALYRRDDGKLILHRVTSVSDTYTFCGDNQFIFEHNVRHDQVLAIVSAFLRGERLHRTDESLYKLYCRFWCLSRPIRHFYRRAVSWLRRHLE